MDLQKLTSRREGPVGMDWEIGIDVYIYYYV